MHLAIFFVEIKSKNFIPKSLLIYKNDNYLFQYYWLLNIVLLILLRTLLIVGIWKARVK